MKTPFLNNLDLFVINACMFINRVLEIIFKKKL